jgi:uncharacterized protein (TIGR02001 family)
MFYLLTTEGKPMKKMIRNSVAGAMLACAPLAATAASPFSANVALTTDYVFRGVTQSDGAPAIQGGFDFNHKSGLYIGIWGSSVDDGVGPAGLEYDLYLGYGGDFGSTGLSYDVGIVNYRYPGGDSASSSNSSEAYVGLSYKMFSAKYYMGVGSLDDDYVELGAKFGIGNGAEVGLHVGRTNRDTGANDTDWKLGLSKEFGGFGFELAYTDTNNNSGCGNSCDGRVVLTVSKSM